MRELDTPQVVFDFVSPDRSAMSLAAELGIVTLDLHSSYRALYVLTSGQQLRHVVKEVLLPWRRVGPELPETARDLATHR
jgi:hypothetical protein